MLLLKLMHLLSPFMSNDKCETLWHRGCLVLQTHLDKHTNCFQIVTRLCLISHVSSLVFFKQTCLRNSDFYAVSAWIVKCAELFLRCLPFCWFSLIVSHKLIFKILDPHAKLAYPTCVASINSNNHIWSFKSAKWWMPNCWEMVFAKLLPGWERGMAPDAILLRMTSSHSIFLVRS